MTAYCHHCRLPTFEGHPKPSDCIAALRTALEPNAIWQDNQRLQKELHAAKAEARALWKRAADEAVRIARGEG